MSHISIILFKNNNLGQYTNKSVFYHKNNACGKFKSQVVGCNDENVNEVHLIDKKFDNFKQRQFSRAREMKVEGIHSNDMGFMVNGTSNFLNI